MPITDINDFIKEIYKLNTIINSNYYIDVIAKTPLNFNNHKKNFKHLNEIINKYNSIYDVFKENVEDNYYLFKCFYDIFIKFLVNIIGFVEYLMMFKNLSLKSLSKSLSTKTKSLSKSLYKSIIINGIEQRKKKYGTIHFYNFQKLLDFLFLEETTKEIEIKKLYEIINYTTKVEDKSDIIQEIPELQIFKEARSKKDISDILTSEIIDKIIKNLDIIIFNNIVKIVELHQTIEKKLVYLNYITIPQYKPICWFTSMITGMSYSNLSKKLINKQIKDNKITTSTFSIFIIKIIQQITNQFNTYDKIEKEGFLCQMLKYLKDEPLLVLNDLIDSNLMNFIIEFKKEKSIDIDLKHITRNDFIEFISYLNQKYLYSKYSYFLHFLDYNLIINEKKEASDEQTCYLDIENSIGYEIFNSDVSVLVYFYDLLNILCKYVYLNIGVYGGYEYYESVFSTEKPTDIPDVIALEYNNKKIDITKESLIKPLTEQIKITDVESGIIIYKGHKYKVDYILHFNDDKVKCDNKDITCGHCISAITYGDEEYIYDSDKLNKYIECPEYDKYRMPCSLIKQKWNKNINKELTYCTTNCQYNIDCNLDKIYKNDLCYTFNYNLIYVYVRID
jgi:hypothetical protein